MGVVGIVIESLGTSWEPQPGLLGDGWVHCQASLEEPAGWPQGLGGAVAAPSANHTEP